MASVVAVGHCHVYTLSGDAFESLAVVYPSWWRRLISERGVLLKKLQDVGVQINAAETTPTHGLQLPQVAGTSTSVTLSAGFASAAASAVSESRRCGICRCNEKCIVSIPCGHIVACEDCHELLKMCTVCRVGIESGVKAYF